MEREGEGEGEGEREGGQVLALWRDNIEHFLFLILVDLNNMK